MIRRLTAAMAVLLMPLASLGAGLEPFKASYAIRWNGMNAGNGELQLERMPDGRWSYRSRVQGRGLFRMALPSNQVSVSVFRLEDDRVTPDTFVSDDANQDIVFDWAAGRVTGKVDGKNIDLPAQEGLLDPMSVQVALMHELLAGRMPTHFVLVDEDRIKSYRYSVEGSETIHSAAGMHRTDIFSSRRPNSKKGTYFWCAPDLGYLPLKVERRNGREVEWSMTLTSLTR